MSSFCHSTQINEIKIEKKTPNNQQQIVLIQCRINLLTDKEWRRKHPTHRFINERYCFNLVRVCHSWPIVRLKDNEKFFSQNIFYCFSTIFFIRIQLFVKWKKNACGKAKKEIAQLKIGMCVYVYFSTVDHILNSVQTKNFDAMRFIKDLFLLLLAFATSERKIAR